MLKPHIVKKIVDSDTDEVLYEMKVEESEQIVSEETVKKIKELMYNVVNSSDPVATGRSYKIEGLDVIGKTGTAEIFDTVNNRYMDGENDYIYSFAGMYPYKDPQIIIYATMKRPTNSGSKGVVDATRSVMESVAKFKNIFNDKSNIEMLDTYFVDSYINESVEKVKTKLDEINLDVIIIGNGNKVINQYPKPGVELISNDKLFLVTNGTEIKIPDMLNWSKNDVAKFFELSNYQAMFDGYGYVYEQSIEKDTILNNELEIIIKFRDKFFDKQENNDDENTE